ncbi:MAG: GNAT family N-acetyltransferase [Clostridiales bacterium]|nr:GNAT family N-acetyltransferase [Clostridiales bacterium]
MNKITYRRLNFDECDRIQEIDITQYIKNAWRVIDGKRQLVEIDYLETNWPDGFERYRNALENIMKDGGIAFGAFNSDGSMVGFVSLNMTTFGETSKYILLDSMFVSNNSRGKGIGKKLFELCCEKGRKCGVDKIYICAGSAEDTVAFYRNCGCIDAIEINRFLYEQDTRDLQLEYKL